MEYNKYLCKKVLEIKPSGIRKFFDLAAEMPDCISLGVGEPNFVTPDYAREAAIESIRRGETKYTSNSGLLELREMISQYLSNRFSVNYSSKEIIITVGASEAIDNTFRVILNEGDEVLIPEPCYVSYSPCVLLAGGKPVILPCKAENGFIVTKEIINEYVTPRTKAIFITFPNNPTGGIMTKEQMEDIVPTIIKNDLLVVTDEIYGELTYTEEGHTSIASFAGMKERTILISGFSKAFAMTGWRIGYLAAPLEICKQLLKIHQYAIMCAPTVAQYTALKCLQVGFEENFATVEMMKNEYNRKRKYLYKRLNDIGLKCFEPLGAFYMFPCVNSVGMDGEEFANKLLKADKVAVVPGIGFGECGKNHIRISYAYSMENIKIALDKIEKFVRNYI